MIDTKEVIEESLPVLSICAAISILSGLFLGKNEELLRMLPGILIIVPSFMAINGNISSVMTSRLSSALHMGLVKPHFRRSKLLERNIHAMLIVAVISFIFILNPRCLISSGNGSNESNFLVSLSTPYQTVSLSLV